jgi:bla regulator protein blaR1
MEIEILRELIAASCFSACAIAMALALRSALRAFFGPIVAYEVWLMVPIALLALLLPLHRLTPDHLSFLGTALPLARQGDAPIGPRESLTITIALWTWAVGACAALVILLWQQARFVKGLTIVARRNGILYARGVPSGPLVIGIVRPQIVVPLDFEDRYTPTEREIVIAHERMHVRRGDPIANAICALLRSTLWFNPLVHFASGRFRFDQELACDEAVIGQNPLSRRSYANAMLKTQLSNTELPLACHWPARHPLEVRITMLKKPRLPRARRAFGSLLTGLAVVAIGYGAWAAQPGAPDPGSTPPLPEANPSPGDTSFPGVMRDNGGALFANADGAMSSWVLLPAPGGIAGGFLVAETPPRHSVRKVVSLMVTAA